MSTRNLIMGLISLTLILAVIFGGVLEGVEHATTTSHSSDSGLALKGVNICFECHDEQQTKGFHYPQTIIGIDERKGLRRRLCVDCHGPEGTDPDNQMSDRSKIEWKEDLGHFRVSSEIVHGIHLKKLDSQVMVCETCHLIKDGDPTQLGTELVIPTPSRGQVLICQMCHLPVDPGNYISVHITYGHHDCSTCHTGDIKDIHIRATSDLGRT